MDPFDPFDFFGDCIAESHWTPGWGNLLTVIVAIAAIVYSARNSKRTLELSAKQFRHTREDTRDDKLRAEIAEFFEALGARPAIRELMGEVAQADPADEARVSEAKSFLIQRFQDMTSPFDVYQKVGVHNWAINVLSDDQTINNLVQQLAALVVADYADFRHIRELIAGPGVDLVNDARADNAQRTAREQAVLAIGAELMNHCSANLRRKW